MTSSWLNVPNVLSLLRLASTPVLLWLAWNGDRNVFLTVLALAFFSDLVDGLIARWFHQMTKIGAILDSWADVAVYGSMPHEFLSPDVQLVAVQCVSFLSRAA